MRANNLLGLIKFFSNEDFLDKLVGGLMHCQNPERYHQSKQEGVSDKHESCSYAWRSERGDSAISILINGKELPSDGLRALTIHNGQPSESWISCWFMLHVPPDANELTRLTTDVKRMKDEFGRGFAFIPHDRIGPFLKNG